MATWTITSQRNCPPPLKRESDKSNSISLHKAMSSSMTATRVSMPFFLFVGFGLQQF
jgi:hypothetical protein